MSLLVAIAAIAVATCARLTLTELWAHHLPFITFYAAVPFAAWYGGIDAGLLATALAAPVAIVFMDPGWPASWEGAASLVLFVGASVFVSGLTEQLHRARARADAAKSAAEAARAEADENLRRARSARIEADEARKVAEYLRAAADAANRSKDVFLATVTHELRQPLSAIVTWSEMLVRGTLDDARMRRAHAAIVANARLQSHLIADLLDVSRIVAGKMLLEMRPVLLADVVRRAVEVVCPSADTKRISLQATFAAGGPVFGDPDRLQQVVWNLLSNAIKFTPAGGRIDVRLERVGSHVELRVADSGQGIDAQFLPRVFDRFEQGESRQGKRTGLGLGLSIVQHIVEAHGGAISAESAGLGQGSVFTVLLPRMATLVRAARKAASGDVPIAPGRIDVAVSLNDVRVLLVELDPSEVLEEESLVAAGANVRVASSHQEANAILSSWDADVVVIDVGTRDGDGHAVIPTFRSWEDRGRRPVDAIALTRSMTDHDGIRLLAGGFRDCLTTPVDPAELICAVASVRRSVDSV